MTEPVFGFLFFGGPLSGALVRDTRLANELAARGFRVHVWWAMDMPNVSPLRPDVRQHLLFNGFRYYPVRLGARLPRGVAEAGGRFMARIWSDRKRHRSLQKRPHIIDALMGDFMALTCDGVDHDRTVVSRFAAQLQESGVTHMLPMLSVLCPWVQAARRAGARDVRYLVTFQGYELYLQYARIIGRDRDLIEVLRNTVTESDFPCIAVSADYADRVHDDIGVARETIHAIPPGVPVEPACRRSEAPEILRRTLKGYGPGVPLVSYLGRCDAEKGVDLFLYAASILRRRGVSVQPAICGPTLFGNHYAQACRVIAQNLVCPVIWCDQISDEARSALFFESRCVVYPSIHREPFGMVPVEAQAHGTPAIVPDAGGVRDTVEANEKTGGLRFRAWDSGDLASAMERLITDDALHKSLSAAGPAVADYFSIARLADRVLAHLNLPSQPGHPERPQPAAKALASISSTR